MGKRHDRDQHRDRIQERSIDANRMQHDPVAEYLRKHGDKHEADDENSSPQLPEHGKALPKLASLPKSEVPETGAGRPERREEDEWQPPRQAERPDQREGCQRSQSRLDSENRELGGDQGRHARAHVRRGAPQGCDSGRHCGLRVQHTAQHPHGRRAIEDAAADAPPGRLDGEVPSFAARYQRNDLQQHGHGKRPRSGAGEGVLELVAAPGEHERENRRAHQGAHHGDRRTVTATESTEGRGHRRRHRSWSEGVHPNDATGRYVPLELSAAPSTPPTETRSSCAAITPARRAAERSSCSFALSEVT